MSGYLLDTNVVSELTKDNPNLRVLDFISAHPDSRLSVMVVQELELGVQLLPEGARQRRLRAWLTDILNEYEGRIVPIGKWEAEWAAIFQARIRKSGGDLKLGDALQERRWRTI